MTFQAKDVLRLRDQDYTLLGRGGGPLFDPNDVGIEPGWNMSANVRGFSSKYAISDNCLLLDGLRINASPGLAQSDQLMRIFGKLPEVFSVGDQMRADGFEHFEHFADSFVLHYSALAAPMRYSGPLLLVKGWLDEEQLLDRFQHNACKYEDVREVSLDDGCLVEEHDRSSLIAAVRKKLLAMPKGEQYKLREEIRLEILSCFSAEYDYRY